jgi:hypothetical protein
MDKEGGMPKELTRTSGRVEEDDDIVTRWVANNLSQMDMVNAPMITRNQLLRPSRVLRPPITSSTSTSTPVASLLQHHPLAIATRGRGSAPTHGQMVVHSALEVRM